MKEFNALWSEWLEFFEIEMPAETAPPMTAETATEHAIADGEMVVIGRRMVVGWEKENGKRNETIVYFGECDCCYRWICLFSFV